MIEEVVADKGTQQSGARRPGALDLRTYIAEPVRGRRNWTQQAAVYVLSMLFASLAVVVACTGLYGLVAYSVVRRTREIGIRLAVGAQRGQVMRLFIKDAAVLVGTGVALGIPASLAAGRQFSTMLYGLDPSNVWMLLVASSILATVAAVAAGLPAARATTVDPATVLREQ